MKVMKLISRVGVAGAVVAVAVGVMGGVGGAQSFNVDIGSITPGAAGGGTPAPSYGAAAKRPGMWNYIAGIGTGPFALVDLENHATGVSCTRDDGLGGLFGFNNTMTTGYFQSLMDDGHNSGGVGTTRTYSFYGLSPGVYTVYSYAWSPLSATDLTSVMVPGSTSANPQIVGGALTAVNTFTAGITHAIHEVTVAPGAPLLVSFAAVNNGGTLNGLQICKGYGLSMGQPTIGGFLVVGNSLGLPNRPYVNLVTGTQGAFPAGPMFGLDLSVADAVAQISLGPPFFGLLDQYGAASFTGPGVIPSGITMYFVSIDSTRP